MRPSSIKSSTIPKSISSLSYIISRIFFHFQLGYINFSHFFKKIQVTFVIFRSSTACCHCHFFGQGASLGVLGVASGTWMWLAYIFSAILLLAGIFGFCPLHTLFKFSTKIN